MELEDEKLNSGDINIREHTELPVFRFGTFLVSITIYRVIQKELNTYKNILHSNYHMNM